MKSHKNEDSKNPYIITFYDFGFHKPGLMKWVSAHIYEDS